MGKDRALFEILPRVQKPARYSGGEYGEIIKDKSKVSLRMALCFPDTYEIGMSNLGMRILYGAINEMPEVWCERVFAPWTDMEQEMRREGFPLWALESGDPVSEFDVVGFSLGYEMAYTNVLNMLDLAGIPLKSNDRPELSPLIAAGGTCACNPEPLADFVDLFFVGEGEEMDRELLELYLTARNENWDKPRFLRAASGIGGVYVPSLYGVSYGEDGLIAGIAAKDGAPETVTKRVVTDFESSFYPVHTLIPTTEIVHDRVVLELFRGCIRGCRFCQAGYSYRPVRCRSAEKLAEQGREALESSGYQEVTLSSLSTSDYPELKELCDGLMDWCEPRSVNLSLPSLRADNFSMDIMQRAQKVRKSGLTFAPEAGSQRLRDAINKNVTEEELLNSCRVAFEGGWSTVKLYFMLGLPTETDEDVLAIADLAGKVLGCWKRHATNKSRGVRITVSTSCFVPKPHTPFQWEAQIPHGEYLRRVTLLRENMRHKAITYNWHDGETGLIEAALSRGDRRLGPVLLEVWRNGGKMESWSENFSLARWMEAFRSENIYPEFYANRVREKEEILPWSHISQGISQKLLWTERENAYAARLSPDCSVKCAGCGASALAGSEVCRPRSDAEKTVTVIKTELPMEAGADLDVKYRLRFTKTGRAVYASHLDLMRTMHRALLRAGLRLKYSEGFNPHPVMSILLPLPLGMSSRCELMDVRLREIIDPGSLAGRINPVLPEGIEVIEACAPERKVKELKWLDICGRFDYPDAVTPELVKRLESFFGRDSIVIRKRTKKGEGELDIAPWILSPVFKCNGSSVCIKTRLSAQEPTINPELLVSALSQLEPELSPEFAQFARVEVFDGENRVFR